jgi:type I restriction enzyme, S subunit
VALFDSKYEIALINAQMLILRADRDRVDPVFLFYQFRSPAFQQTLRAYSSGSAQPQLPIKSLKEIPIAIPPMREQRAIAEVLSSLENKIELNRRMNETLESFARALFKAWFVDFYPVRAKSEGLEPGLPQPIVDLFPERLVSSALGKSPEGWRVSKIGNEVTTVLGGTPSRSEPTFWGGDIPWINSGRANEFRVMEPSEFITRKGLASSATKLLPARTTILAITGATLGQISLTEIETCTNQSIVGVLGAAALPSEYTYFWMKEHVDDLLTWQTGGAFHCVRGRWRRQADQEDGGLPPVSRR